MEFTIYLSGEIHSQWRDEIQKGLEKYKIEIIFLSPVTDHNASDSAGDHLGKESNSFWRDHKSAKINAIRTKTLIKNCDLVVIRFGEKYKQWNAAFDAGYCSALGIPYITLHSVDLNHPLKEVDAAAMATTTSTEQVVKVIKYLIQS